MERFATTSKMQCCDVGKASDACIKGCERCLKDKRANSHKEAWPLRFCDSSI